jgi:phosphoribosylcarboxyaminoimidazole (NCAIR) mutase
VAPDSVNVIALAPPAAATATDIAAFTFPAVLRVLAVKEGTESLLSTVSVMTGVPTAPSQLEEETKIFPLTTGFLKLQVFPLLAYPSCTK